MKIDPQQLINSKLGVSLAFGLGRVVPPKLGYPLVNFIADRIAARRNWKMVEAVRLNQWVIQGEKPGKEELDRAVRDMFRSNARSIYDLYHYIHDRCAMRQMIVLNPVAQSIIQRSEFAERGVVLVGLHFSNFDFVLQAGCLQGLKALVLTLPHLNNGYRLQFDLRLRTGMNLRPATPSVMKQAVGHLRAGGQVLTGIDRPDKTSAYRPLFFNKPAALPVHHIFLALKARVPVIVMATILLPDGKYHLLSSNPIEMQPYSDRRIELLQNAERVLHVAEDFIRLSPHQWSMTFPVWPDLIDHIPE